MNKLIVYIAGCLFLAMGLPAAAQTTTSQTTATRSTTSSTRTLVVFFSQTGHTRAVGEAIRDITGADLFELVAQEPYPTDYHAIRVRAKAEQEQDLRPALVQLPADISRYDTIFVGSPIWNHTLAQPLATFLGAYDFSGKILVPFCTHGGGGAGRSVSDLHRRAPRAILLPSYATTGSPDLSALRHWINSL